MLIRTTPCISSFLALLLALPDIQTETELPSAFRSCSTLMHPSCPQILEDHLPGVLTINSIFTITFYVENKPVDWFTQQTLPSNQKARMEPIWISFFPYNMMIPYPTKCHHCLWAFQNTEKCHSFTLGSFLSSQTLWTVLYTSAKHHMHSQTVSTCMWKRTKCRAEKKSLRETIFSHW